jgi:hypothetical protein
MHCPRTCIFRATVLVLDEGAFPVLLPLLDANSEPTPYTAIIRFRVNHPLAVQTFQPPTAPHFA